MKQILFFSCFLILLGACTSSEPEIYSNPPGKEFVRFCSDIATKTGSSDTTRLVSKQLYGELSYKSIQWVDGQPFYPILFENSRINSFLKSEGKSLEGCDVFARAETIWGYFYYKQNPDGMFPDGVIEEWKFTNQADAKIASEIFDQIGTEVFFNTEPYHCVIGNRLYLFHSRSMAFSFDQKSIFEEFVKRNKASI
ncbi:hypothetical protein [Fluviicola sp.]|uniref:hypothetical protein n=1 Tax=Fluviicola sp. TaxID=1917219 RepID=UPI003D2C4FBB